MARSRIRIPLSLVVLAAALSAQTPSGEKRYSLRGEVIDDLTGRPVSDVELELQTAKWEPAADPVTPDSHGHFTFQNIPTGEYILSAARPDLGIIFWHELPDPGWIQTIQMRPGDEDKSVLFRLIRRAVVTGVVRDDFGDPVQQAMVMLSQPTWIDGKVSLQFAGQVSTDDRGQYRIINVAPGPYVLCASYPMGNLPAPLSSSVDLTSPGTRDSYYTRACYPTAGEGTFQLTPGQQAAVDLTIVAAPAVRIRGRLLGALPNLGAGIRLVREASTDGQVWQATVDAEMFEFRGIPPGNYRVFGDFNGQTSEGEKVSLAGTARVSVGTTDIDDVQLALERTAEIELSMHDPEGRAVDSNVVAVNLTPAIPGIQLGVMAQDGVLKFAPVPPGVYRLMTRSIGSDVCAQSAKLGDQELLHGGLDVTPGMKGRIDVTVSKRCGTIKGRVTAKGDPVPDAKVVLLDGPAKDPENLITNFTDDRGEFSFGALPFGRYQLWAWKMDRGASYLGPESLAKEESHGTSVSVRNEAPVSAEVELLEPEKQTK